MTGNIQLSAGLASVISGALWPVLPSQLEASRTVPDWRGKLHHAISDAMTRGDLGLDAIADEVGIAKDETQIKIDYAAEVKKIIDTKLGSKGI